MALTKAEKNAVKNFRKRIKNDELISKALIQPKSMSEHVKKELCMKMIDLANKHSLSQADVARITESSRPQINEIFRYHIDRFTIDFLVDKIFVLQNSLDNNSPKKLGIKELLSR